MIGHRGARGLAPENTWSAIMEALRCGVRAIEIDVHLTRDGEAVLIHDETLNRTTSGRGPVASFGVQKLLGLDAGRWFSKVFVGERLPLLRDVLTYLPHSVTVMIEIKHQSSQARSNRLAERVQAIVTECRAEGRAILASSNYRCLKHLGKTAASKCFIYSQPKRLPVAVADKFRAIQGFSWNCELWDATLAKQLKRLKKTQYAWVINNPQQGRLWKQRGMAGVITDYPDRF